MTEKVSCDFLRFQTEGVLIPSNIGGEKSLEPLYTVSLKVCN